MPKKGEFQVHGMAAGKRAKKPKREPPAPVKVIRANREALAMAHEAVKGRDVHMVLLGDGSIEIRNGRKEPK